MAGMLYYIGKIRTANAESIHSAGLSYALDGESVTQAPTGRGPDGGAGVMLSLDPGGHLGGADKCRWFPMKAEQHSGVWFGFDEADPPGPDVLVRRELVGGWPVILGDGRSWIVPVARRITGGPAVPRRIEWNGKAWTPGDVLPQFKMLYDQACKAFDSVIAGGGSATFDDECGMLAHAITINYRIGPEEISALGLLTTACNSAAFGAILDFPALDELKKKTDGDGLSSTAGGAG